MDHFTYIRDSRIGIKLFYGGSRRGVARGWGRRRLTTKETLGTFWSGGNVLNLEWEGGYSHQILSKSLNCTAKIDAFYVNYS